MKLFWLVAAISISLFGAAGAQAASFDCARAVTADEHAVCRDPQLSRLDDLLPKAYAQAKQATPDEDMTQYARDFIANRHACGAKRGCILGNYVGILSDYRNHGADDMPLGRITAPMVAEGEAPESGALPQKIGHCVTTTVTDISPRVDTFDSGTEIAFANGGLSVSYEREEALIHSRLKDKVVMCLISIPHNCPAGDDRGKSYLITNLRTKASWNLGDSQHMCGGP